MTEHHVVRSRALWLLSACLLAGGVLSACKTEPDPTSTPPPSSPARATTVAEPTSSPTAVSTPTPTPSPVPATATPAAPTATATPALTLSTGPEREAYRRLSALVPWMADLRSPLRVRVAEAAIDLWLDHAAVAESLVQASWFQDGVTSRDLEVLRRLGDLASRNPAVAGRVALSTWFGDSVSDAERELLDLLGPDQPSASFLVDDPEYVGVLSDDLVRFFLSSFRRSPQGGISDQAWVTDGLSPLEMAFVVAISAVDSEYPLLYRDLLLERYAATRTTSLPLAGEVSLYVFQNSPISDSAYILDRMEKTARALEELLDVPFPTTEFILLVGDSTAVDYSLYRGSHYGSHMRLTRYASIGVASIAHEVAHYVFWDGPQWFTEGGAEFVALYVDDAVDVSRYARREDAPPSYALSCLSEGNAENIRHHALLSREAGPLHGIEQCAYALGEWFLVHLYDALGEEALGSALRAWYLDQPGLLRRTGSAGPRLVDPADIPHRERQVFEALSRGVPEPARKEFERLYVEMHGGVGGGPDDGIPDDVGDGVGSSSVIVPGETITASLDHDFDFDYFRFSAAAGRKYELDFGHRTPTSRLAIYSFPASYEYDGSAFYEYEGDVLRRITPAVSDLPAYRIWVAPRSGDFYLAVQNFGGAPGPYTLSITPLEEVRDDHGDGPPSATDVALGVEAEGRLDGALDFDYFRFRPVKGKTYRIEIAPGGDQEFFVWKLDSAGRDPWEGPADPPRPHPGNEPYSSGWIPGSDDYHYVALSTVGRGAVSYTIVITEDQR